MVDTQNEMSINFVRLHFIDPQKNTKKPFQMKERAWKNRSFCICKRPWPTMAWLAKTQRCQFGIYEFELAEKKQIHSRFKGMFMDNLTIANHSQRISCQTKWHKFQRTHYTLYTYKSEHSMCRYEMIHICIKFAMQVIECELPNRQK